jgi:hypothetical protein
VRRDGGRKVSSRLFSFETYAVTKARGGKSRWRPFSLHMAAAVVRGGVGIKLRLAELDFLSPPGAARRAP